MSALIQNTDDWLEFRKGKVGASDASIIMGVSPWKTQYELWLEKLGLSSTQETWSMKEGKRREEEARQEFERMTGLVVFPAVLTHPEHEWMIASLDGIDIEHENIVELKCPGNDDHQQALSGSIPDKYIPQLQHQLAVTGLKKAYYFSYHGKHGVIVEVYRDDAYIKNMIEKEQEFYQCLQELTPPPLSNMDYVQKNDDLWQTVSERWKNASEQLRRFEKSEKELREALIHLADNKNCIGNGIKLTKSLRRGVIDYKAIPELEGIDVEKYRKENTASWRISECQM